MARATVPSMTDIYDAIARGFRYPRRSDEFDDELGYDEHDHDTEVLRALPGLDAAELRSLADAVDTGLRERGCDNTLRAARAWARRNEVRWGWLRRALEDRGGFCDCEVLLNVADPPG